MSKRRLVQAGLAVTLAVWPAHAQSDPALFDTVYNIGPVPVGTIFHVTNDDIPGTLVQSGSIGDGDPTEAEAPVSPTMLLGDILTSNSQLNLFEQGRIRSWFSIGHPDGSSTDVEVNVLGGDIGSNFNVYRGAIVNIFEGRWGNLYAHDGSTINIVGGRFPVLWRANAGSTVNMTGGLFDNSLQIRSGAHATISGGGFSQFIDVDQGSALTLVGDHFERDGQSVSDLIAGFGLTNTREVFTGVFGDGTVFIFNGPEDEFAAGSTTLQQVNVPASTNPSLLDSGVFSKGVRRGESLTVVQGGSLGGWTCVVGGVLNMQGGHTDGSIEVFDGEVNISAGVIEGRVLGLDGARITITGGDLAYFDAETGSSVEVSGGSLALDQQSRIERDAAANITGGVLGRLRAGSHSALSVSGGSIGSIEAYFNTQVTLTGGDIGIMDFNIGSRLEIRGTSFALGGVELTDLQRGVPFTIKDRDTTLTGTFLDGSAFSYDLNASGNNQDVFVTSATVMVTLVARCNADFDADNDVDLGDFGFFAAAFDSRVGDINYAAAADFDHDGDVDLGDFGVLGEQFDNGPAECAP